MNSIQALQECVRRAASQSACAAVLGTSQQRISYLLRHGRQMPAEFVLRAEQAFGIPRHVIRPDIYPSPAGVSLDTPEVACGGDAVSCNPQPVLPATGTQQ